MATILRFDTEAEWLRARFDYVTASDVALLMGSEKHREWSLSDNPNEEPVIVRWREKVEKRGQERSPSIAARMGLALEPLVLTLYGELTGHEAVKSYTHYGMHVRGCIAASLDAATVDHKGRARIVDAKTGMYGAGNWAKTYEWSSRCQMHVVDVDYCDLACLHKAQAKMSIEVIERDLEAEARMVRAANEFMEFVRTQKEPPQDWIAAQGSEF